MKIEVPNNEHKEIPGNPTSPKSSKYPLRRSKEGLPLRVLSEEDWDFWIHNGYVIIKNAISKEQAADTVKFIWEFEEKDPNNTQTWYTPQNPDLQMKELAYTGMVECYNNQKLWNNRMTQKVYDAFVDVWGREELWVTIDRCNLNFPIKEGHEYKGFIHWDYDPEEKPQQVQGVLALVDQTDENMGGFQCIPELFRTYDTWKLKQPEDRHHFLPDTTGFTPTKVKMEAGDLLIFNASQPHGIRENHSKSPRLAQYISMMPAEEENEELVGWRVDSWENRIAPQGYAFPGDPRNWEQTKYPQATLNNLGEKLLGLKKW